MSAEAQCLWTTGVITKDWTALPETEHMNNDNISQAPTEHAGKFILMARPLKLGPVPMLDGECGPQDETTAFVGA